MREKRICSSKDDYFGGLLSWPDSSSVLDLVKVTGKL